jgi:hypothetical protein
MKNRNQADGLNSNNLDEAQGKLAHSLCLMTCLHAQSEALVLSMLAQMRAWQDHGIPSEESFETMELGWEYLWHGISDKLKSAMDSADTSYGELFNRHFLRRKVGSQDDAQSRN